MLSRWLTYREKYPSLADALAMTIGGSIFVPLWRSYEIWSGKTPGHISLSYLTGLVLEVWYAGGPTILIGLYLVNRFLCPEKEPDLLGLAAAQRVHDTTKGFATLQQIHVAALGQTSGGAPFPYDDEE